MTSPEHESEPRHRQTIRKLDDLFAEKLRVGEVAANENSEWIEGINIYGQPFRIARPTLDVDAGLDDADIELRYVIDMRAPIDGTFYNLKIVLSENRQPHLFTDTDILLGNFGEDQDIEGFLTGIIL